MPLATRTLRFWHNAWNHIIYTYTKYQPRSTFKSPGGGIYRGSGAAIPHGGGWIDMVSSQLCSL